MQEENKSSSSSSAAAVKRQRKPEANLRNEHLEAGALLLSFESIHENVIQARVKSAWHTIEKKGFRILRDIGCLIPHESYYTPAPQHGTITAVKIAMQFFTNTSPDPSKIGSHNQLGWPEHQEYSHLCHNFTCCNPSHIVIESFWCNRKRNFCGINGNCDCGMKPACIKSYKNRDGIMRDIKELANNSSSLSLLLQYSDHNLATQIHQLIPLANSIRILPKNYYHVEDVKRINRIKRLRRGNVHKKQAKKNDLKRKDV